VTLKEKLIIRKTEPYLRKNGIQLAGIDVIGEKLIEINVTCPGALIECDELYPGIHAVKKWADAILRD